MGLLLLFTLAAPNNLLHIERPTVKQVILTPTRKNSKLCKVSKTSINSKISKNVPIMHKTHALREEFKIFRGNQLTQNV